MSTISKGPTYPGQAGVISKIREIEDRLDRQEPMRTPGTGLSYGYRGVSRRTLGRLSRRTRATNANVWA